MAKGLSLHIGVNKADSRFEVAPLLGCHKDAEAMQALAFSHNFQLKGVLLDEAAKFEAVKQKISEAANELQSGDMFFFTFSGHGSTQPTLDNTDEPDRQDETILLFDCILIDNYLRRNLWSQFREGVRILAVADCCHAGSALFGAPPSVVAAVVGAAGAGPTGSISVGRAPQIKTQPQRGTPIGTIREFTSEEKEKIVGVSPGIHNKIKNEISAHAKKVSANLMTLAACRDNEKALDGDDNGAFTKELLKVLATSPQNYDQLMSRVTDNLIANNIDQHPTRFPQLEPDPAFINQLPFSIN